MVRVLFGCFFVSEDGRVVKERTTRPRRTVSSQTDAKGQKGAAGAAKRGEVAREGVREKGSRGQRCEREDIRGGRGRRRQRRVEPVGGSWRQKGSPAGGREQALRAAWPATRPPTWISVLAPVASLPRHRPPLAAAEETHIAPVGTLPAAHHRQRALTTVCQRSATPSCLSSSSPVVHRPAAMCPRMFARSFRPTAARKDERKSPADGR